MNYSRIRQPSNLSIILEPRFVIFLSSLELLLLVFSNRADFDSLAELVEDGSFGFVDNLTIFLALGLNSLDIGSSLVDLLREFADGYFEDFELRLNSVQTRRRCSLKQTSAKGSQLSGSKATTHKVVFGVGKIGFEPRNIGEKSLLLIGRRLIPRDFL